MTTGGGSGDVEPWLVWSVGVLSTLGDVPVVTSIVCTESLIVLVSVVGTLW